MDPKIEEDIIKTVIDYPIDGFVNDNFDNAIDNYFNFIKNNRIRFVTGNASNRLYVETIIKKNKERIKKELENKIMPLIKEKEEINKLQDEILGKIHDKNEEKQSEIWKEIEEKYGEWPNLEK